jgi:hypothetical protein
VTRPFRRYKTFLPCDLDLGVRPIFENPNLSHIFFMIDTGALIFHMNEPSVSEQKIDVLTLVI